MTELNRLVARKTRDQYNVLHHRKARRIVARLVPGDVLEFSELGCRRRWTLPIDQVFRIAVRCSAGMGLCFVPVCKRKD